MPRLHGGISDDICDTCGLSEVDDLGWYSCTCKPDDPPQITYTPPKHPVLQCDCKACVESWPG